MSIHGNTQSGETRIRLKINSNQIKIMKTKNTLITAAMFATMSLYAGYPSPIEIDTVHVGDANNAADTRTSVQGGTPGAGAVAYDYYIGKTEVTAGQYTAFLNAVATSTSAASYITGLYNENMAIDDMTTHGCGIVRTDNLDGTCSYTVTNGNLPVNYVSVYDAMRFCNWLTSGNTEYGIYNLAGVATPDITTIVRDATAWANGGIAIASLDEWYKAAFYNGSTGTYSVYANGTNVAPTALEANYNISGIGTITDVDFGAESFYGTLGQNGNVWEWTETVAEGSSTNVYLRGGAFYDAATALRASSSASNAAATESYDYGFRVSSLEPIPEPSTYAAIFGALALAVAVYRKHSIGPKE